MKKLLSVTVCVAVMIPAMSQNRTQNGTLTSQKKYPLLNYFEIVDYVPEDPAQWAGVKGVKVSWGEVDSSYAKTSVPLTRERHTLSLDAWRGEVVSALALVWSATAAQDITFSLGDLKGPGVIPGASAETGFVRYNPDPDVIDTFPQSLDLQPMNVQPYWLALRVPCDAAPGTYKGTLSVKCGADVAGVLSLTIKVDSRLMPDPSKWTGVPSIIPNPWSVARYYHQEEWKTEYTEPWSEKHFEYMRPLMERLSSLGVRDIPVFDYDGKSSFTDRFRPMTVSFRGSDGRKHVYTEICDRWIAFMRSCGFDGDIVFLNEEEDLPGDVIQYNSWPAEVLLDSRPDSSHPDDSFLVYPGNRPSVRWMLLLREIQNNQKIICR